MPTPNLETLKNKEIEELSSEWKNMLAHQINNLGTMNHYWNQLPDFFKWMNQTIS